MNEDEMVMEVRNHSVAARHSDVVRMATAAALLVAALLVAASLPWACGRQIEHVTALSPTQLSVAFDERVSCHVADRGPRTIASVTPFAPRMPIAPPAMGSPSSGPPPPGEEERIDSTRPYQWDMVSRPLIIELRI